MSKVIFITATDTGIGKTIFSACLCRSLQKQGKNFFYLKPIQTGSPPNFPEDPVLVLKLLNLKGNPLEHVIYNFKLPASPHLAAKVENKNINIAYLKEKILDFINKYEFIVLEGAGGAMVPITEKYLTIDLLKELKLPVIIVSRTKLGTLNHTLLTVEALKIRSIPILGIVFNFASNPLSLIEKDNILTLEKLTGVKTLGIIPKVKEITSEFELIVNNLDLGGII